MTMVDEVPKSELMDGNHTNQQKHYLNDQTELNQQITINLYDENAQNFQDKESISCSN